MFGFFFSRKSNGGGRRVNEGCKKGRTFHQQRQRRPLCQTFHSTCPKIRPTSTVMYPNMAILGAAIATGAITCYGLYHWTKAEESEPQKKDPFGLPPLPFKKYELEPFISQQTVEFHYEKHHRGYVTKLNEIAKGTPLEKKSLEEIILSETGKPFNLAAQIWNHSFYWESMDPRGGGVPSGDLLKAIELSFGSFEKFKEQFSGAANNHFGSGWVWLVREKESNKLAIIETHDAGNPLTNGFVPLLTCDVWEHAYYIDQRNNRAAYVSCWWNVVNWNAVEKKLYKPQ